MLGPATGNTVDQKRLFQYNIDMLEDKYMTMLITEITEPATQEFLAEELEIIESVVQNPQWSPVMTAEDFLAEMAQWQ